jgi:hypothetical protein
MPLNSLGCPFSSCTGATFPPVPGLPFFLLYRGYLFPPVPGLPPQPEVEEAPLVGCVDSEAKPQKASVRANS